MSHTNAWQKDSTMEETEQPVDRMIHLTGICQPLSSGTVLLTIRVHELSRHGSTDKGCVWM